MISPSVIQPDGSNIQCISSVLGSSGKLGRSATVPNTVIYWSGVGAHQFLTVVYWSGVGAHQSVPYCGLPVWGGSPSVLYCDLLVWGGSPSVPYFPSTPAPISGSAMKSLPIALKHRGAGRSQLPSTGSHYVTTLMV